MRLIKGRTCGGLQRPEPLALRLGRPGLRAGPSTHMPRKPHGVRMYDLLCMVCRFLRIAPACGAGLRKLFVAPTLYEGTVRRHVYGSCGMQLESKTPPGVLSHDHYGTRLSTHPPLSVLGWSWMNFKQHSCWVAASDPTWCKQVRALLSPDALLSRHLVPRTLRYPCVLLCCMRDLGGDPHTDNFNVTEQAGDHLPGYGLDVL